MKEQITVTLQQIKDAHPCKDGWSKVLKANGGTKAAMDLEFPLVSILDSNNLQDTLWVISNVPEFAKYDELWREFVRWGALQNIEKISQYCSSKDYALIVEWLKTGDLDLRESAWSAARAVAEATEAEALSAEEAAEPSAWLVAGLVAWSARWSAELVAWSAARSVAEVLSWSAARVGSDNISGKGRTGT